MWKHYSITEFISEKVSNQSYELLPSETKQQNIYKTGKRKETAKNQWNWKQNKKSMKLKAFFE